MNKIWILGNLTKDPQKKQLENSEWQLCTFTVASNRGHNVEGVDFFTVNVWGKFAETCLKYLKKGSRVDLWGTLRSKNFENSEGARVTILEVNASEVNFLSAKAGEPEVGGVALGAEVPDDDLPF